MSSENREQASVADPVPDTRGMAEDDVSSSTAPDATPSGWVLVAYLYRCPTCGRTERVPEGNSERVTHVCDRGPWGWLNPDALAEHRHRMLRELVNRFDSMPDAGLTNDDPRSAWYAESFALRRDVHLFLRDPSWMLVHGKSALSDDAQNGVIDEQQHVTLRSESPRG